MAYSDFTLDRLKRNIGLIIREADGPFAEVPLYDPVNADPYKALP